MTTKQTFRIAHLSDIHVKDSRREEYLTVFEKLYAKLRTEQLDVIAICGDIFHDKTKASAHNFSDVADFLASLTRIAPVVLIPGNHDLNVKTPGAPDLISPVVNNHTILKEPNFVYWRHSGVYYFQQLIWVVIAPDGPQPSEQEVTDFVTVGGWQDVPRICLVHETINKAALFNGTSLESKRLNASDLTSYDAVLAGDIHLRQPIGSNGRAMYVGSLVQQNIGEDYEKHGFLTWELTVSKQVSGYRTILPKISEFDVANERGYLKIKIENGLAQEPKAGPRKPNYYELLYDDNTTEAQLDFQVAKFTKLYELAPRAVRPVKSYQRTKSLSFSSLAEAHEDAQSLAVHEQIIRELVGTNNQHLEQVLELHRVNYAKIVTQQQGKSRVRLLDLEFSNIYCYGQDNLIDFTKLENKISGVIASNQSGKSALVDVIVFALYDEYPRADRKVSIINEKYDNYSLQLRFEVDGKQGVIKKSGRKTRNTSSTECSFLFNNEVLTQGTATLTCKEIEKIVGNYDDAQVTAISHQGSQSDFVNLRPTERKKSLSQLLSLGYFELLEKTTKEEYNEANFELKLLEKTFQGSTCEQIEEEITVTSKECQEKATMLRTVDQLLANNELELRSYFKQVEANKSAQTEIKEKLAIIDTSQLPRLEEARQSFEELVAMCSEEEFLAEKTHLVEFSTELTGEKLATLTIPSKQYLHELEASVKLHQTQQQEEEKLQLATLAQLEASIHNIQFLVTERSKKLKTEYPDLVIDQEKMQIKNLGNLVGHENEKPWPTSRKGDRINDQGLVARATNDLAIFANHKETALQLITEKLASYQPRKIPEEKLLVSEYQDLEGSLVKDRQLVAEKANLLREVENIRANLRFFEAEQNFQNEIMSTTSLHESKQPRSHDLLELRRHLEHAKTELLIAKNRKSIAGKLIFAANCSCCNANQDSFVQDNLVQLELLWNELAHEFTTLLTSKLQTSRIQLAESLQKLTETEMSERRINRLPILAAELEQLAQYKQQMSEKAIWENRKKALEIVEIASYWWTKDREYWKQYQLCSENLEAIRNSENEITLLRERKGKLSRKLDSLTKLSSETTTLLDEKKQHRNLWLRETHLAWEALAKAKEKAAELAYHDELCKRKAKLKSSLNILEGLLVDAEKKGQELALARDRTLTEQSLAENKLSLLTTSFKNEQTRAQKQAVIQQKTAILAIYRKIIDPKVGIADYLLKKSCSFLENEVNSILADCSASFKIVINEDFELETISSANREKKTVSAKLSSGYQKFVLGLAFRSSLWRLAETTLLDCRFIDEGFGACDEDNLELLIQYIGMSSTSHLYPRINFIVSHVEMMKNAIQVPLAIEVLAGGSKIRNLP